MLAQPEALHRLLGKLAQSVILYLNAQIDAGAQVVQLFDTWAGILSRTEYAEFVQPYHAQIIEAVQKTGVPVILYVNNSRGLMDLMAEAGPDVISVDHLTSLTDAAAIAGPDFSLQGNLDSNALFTPPDVLKSLTEAMLAEAPETGYIANLGHGILPTTPVEHVRLFVDTVHAYQPALQPA